MLETAEGGPLHGLRRGVPRVDLDDPAETVALVRFLRAIEAEIELLPAHALTFGDAVTAHRRSDSLAAVEIHVEIFLAREVGAPRRHAIRTVVEGAEHLTAGRVCDGLQRVMPRSWAGDRHGREGADPACVVGWRDHSPRAIRVFDLDHRHAVGCLRLAHLLRGPALHAVGVQQPVVGVFVVDHQQSTAGIPRAVGQRKEVHPVVMHARLEHLFVRTVRRIVAEGGLPLPAAGRVSPAPEHGRAVTCGNVHAVFRRDRHRVEAEKLAARPGGFEGRPSCAAECGQDRQGDAALEDRAPRDGALVVLDLGGGVAKLVIVYRMHGSSGWRQEIQNANERA